MEKETALINIRKVVEGNKLNYARFMAGLMGTSHLVRKAMVMTYERAIADMSQLLDEAKVKPEGPKLEP